MDTYALLCLLSSSIALNVTILVEYDPLPDFTLQSPPYYRPATPVSLTCVVNDGTPPMGYRWSSTCSNCFASHSRSSHISTSVLNANDAGTHKCTAYDAEGRSGYATSEMKLIGKFTHLLSDLHMYTLYFRFIGSVIYIHSMHSRDWYLCSRISVFIFNTGAQQYNGGGLLL